MTISSGTPKPMTAPSSARGVPVDSITIAAVVLGLGWVAGAAAPQFSSGVSAVEVYVAVTDANGEPIRDLAVSDFQVLEDGQPQAISTFFAGDFPLTVAIGLDRSFSVAGERLEVLKRAATSFLEALRPEDAVMLLRIGSTVDTVTDRAAVRGAIAETDAFGTTALHDVPVGGSAPSAQPAVEVDLGPQPVRQGRTGLGERLGVPLQRVEQRLAQLLLLARALVVPRGLEAGARVVHVVEQSGQLLVPTRLRTSSCVHVAIRPRPAGWRGGAPASWTLPTYRVRTTAAVESTSTTSARRSVTSSR